jgi:hypothetical protein
MLLSTRLIDVSTRRRGPDSSESEGAGKCWPHSLAPTLVKKSVQFTNYTLDILQNSWIDPSYNVKFKGEI